MEGAVVGEKRKREEEEQEEGTVSEGEHGVLAECAEPLLLLSTPPQQPTRIK